MQLFEGTPWSVYRAGTISALILLGLFLHWFQEKYSDQTGCYDLGYERTQGSGRLEGVMLFISTESSQNPQSGQKHENSKYPATVEENVAGQQGWRRTEAVRNTKLERHRKNMSQRTARATPENEETLENSPTQDLRNQTICIKTQTLTLEIALMDGNTFTAGS